MGIQAVRVVASRAHDPLGIHFRRLDHIACNATNPLADSTTPVSETAEALTESAMKSKRSGILGQTGVSGTDFGDPITDFWRMPNCRRCRPAQSHCNGTNASITGMTPRFPSGSKSAGTPARNYGFARWAHCSRGRTSDGSAGTALRGVVGLRDSTKIWPT